MKLSILTLALSAWCVWDILYDRARFAANLAADRGRAISVAAMIWCFSVQASGVTPDLAALLVIPSVVALAYTTWIAALSMWRSWRASRAKPRMDSHELMSLAEDIAMADRLRASADKADHWRARKLLDDAVAQAARRA